MIKIENISTYGFEAAVRGMRNPLNSWEESDSYFGKNVIYSIGKKDLTLMQKLAKAGADHGKYLRMINVTMDITAPLYWWKEFDTYKVGTVRNSCSTMHKIHSRDLTIEDFSAEHLLPGTASILQTVIDTINLCRGKYIREDDIEYWYQMIQLLPSSYNQRSTVQLNYEVLRKMYFARKNHKLVEWREFCKAIEELPYFKEIFLDEEKCENNIPAENVSELEAAVCALEGIKRERLMEELKKGNLFEEKDGVTMITRLSGGIFLPADSEGGEDDD